jgi:hypothetical protein
MAEQIISPGVFTRENDQSFLPQGVGAIGAAIVGPTVKGPAFVPTVVKSFAEYERLFGSLSSETFVPQTVREYLRNAGSVTVCRVLAGGGYAWSLTQSPIAVVAGKSGTAAAFATGSITFDQAADGHSDGTPDNITIGTTKFVFVDDTDAFTSTATQVFVDFGSSKADSAANLRTAINDNTGTHGLNDLLTVDIDGSDDFKLNITGSSAGTAANLDITVDSDGSGDITVTDIAGGAKLSSEDNILLGMIYPSKVADGSIPTLLGSNAESEITTVDPTISSAELDIILTGSGVTGKSFIASFNPSNTNNLFKQLGNSPDNSKTGATEYNGTPGYTYIHFKSLATALSATTDASSSGYDDYGSGNSISFVKAVEDDYTSTTYTEGYLHASTPFIKSQLEDNKDLFRFHSVGHGDKCNTDYKISIANLKEPSDIDGEEQYSTFTILVRAYKDKDKSPTILEQYNNVNLDPDSSNYIARVIGDRHPQYNDTLGKVELLGNYSNISSYIRVEVADAVASKSTSPKLSPKGFGAVINPVGGDGAYGSIFVVPSASFETVQQIGGNYNTRGYLGWKFDDKETDNKNFLKVLPQKTITSNVSGDFNVENYNGHADSGLWAGSLSASVDTTGATGPTADQLKFTVCFQGGTDGIAPYTPLYTGNESSLAATYTGGTNLYGFDLSASDKAGYKGYKKAIDILSNQDEYDINMLALPGVIKSLHPSVTNAGIDMCEERGDAFFVMDLTQYDSSVNTAINDANGLDTNYAAVYYPWVKVLDTAKNKPVLVPPSVIVPGAIAASDRIAAEWFAPAGLNRGVLGNVLEAKMRLNQAERDRLYNAKINPIATFPQTGVCIWGQKTLQERSTALDRINVRRLLIALKKFIASSSRYLVFEQNTNVTRNRFLNIVNPYLESVQQRQGLYSFRVQMDEANNTADVIDRNQLVGAIYLQPTKTAEFIVLDFNVLPTGATFE